MYSIFVEFLDSDFIKSTLRELKQVLVTLPIVSVLADQGGMHDPFPFQSKEK